MLLGATVVLQSASLRETVAAFAPVYPWLVFGAGILLGWRFKRSQLVVALVVLFAAERAIMVFPPPARRGRPVRIAFAAVGRRINSIPKRSSTVAPLRNAPESGRKSSTGTRSGIDGCGQETQRKTLKRNTP